MSSNMGSVLDPKILIFSMVFRSGDLSDVGIARSSGERVPVPV